MKGYKRVIALICVLCLSFGILNIGAASAENAPTTDIEGIENELATSNESYFAYYEANGKAVRPSDEISLDFEGNIGTAKQDTKEKLGGIALYEADTKEEADFGEWTFEVKESGVYSLYPTYYPLEATGKDIQISVEIDGKNPFLEAAEMSLNRIWVDKQEKKDGSYAKDKDGNELRPEQIEAPRWNTKAFSG
jgi:hypothetical protein